MWNLPLVFFMEWNVNVFEIYRWGGLKLPCAAMADRHTDGQLPMDCNRLTRPSARVIVCLFGRPSACSRVRSPVCASCSLSARSSVRALVCPSSARASVHLPFRSPGRPSHARVPLPHQPERSILTTIQMRSFKSEGPVFLDRTHVFALEQWTRCIQTVVRKLNFTKQAKRRVRRSPHITSGVCKE